MGNKYITDAGKTEILKMAFVNNTNPTPFAYFALGGDTGTASTDGENFSEISDATYHRVVTTVEEEPTNKRVVLSGIFDENNYNSSNDITIGELGLCNSPDMDDNTIFFAYCQVPKLPKNGSISLKYSMIITIP